MVYAALIALSLATAGARVGGVTHAAFQAWAHLFVGALVVRGLVKGWRDGRVYLALAIVLSVVEVLTVLFRGLS